MSRLLLVCALALVALTGCSSSPPSSPVDVSDAVVTPVVPGPPPETPDPATDDGALAFATRYVATLNYARTSGDLSGLLPFEDAECQTCQALRHTIAQVYDNGGTITGGTWKISHLGAAKDDTGWSIDGRIHVSRQRIGGTEDDGTTPSDVVPLTMQLVRVDDAWKVLECIRAE